MKIRKTIPMLALLATLLAVVPAARAAEAPKPASDATRAANAALLKELPFGDKTAFELAHKGFVAPLPEGVLKGKAGNPIWDPAKYDFIKEGEPAPDAVNPSLWRRSQLINISGLFEVTDGIYQVRNEDLSHPDSFDFWFNIVTP